MWEIDIIEPANTSVHSDHVIWLHRIATPEQSSCFIKILMAECKISIDEAKELADKMVAGLNQP